MEWIKAVIRTNPAGIEPITGLLITHDVSGMEIVDPTETRKLLTGVPQDWDYIDESALPAADDSASIAFYVAANAEGGEMLAKIRIALDNLILKYGDDLGLLTLVCDHVDDESWLYEWKKYFRPLRIGKVVIVPE